MAEVEGENPWDTSLIPLGDINGGLIGRDSFYCVSLQLHVGFHPREGIVLSTISYADTDAPGASAAAPQERPLFYRLSLAEMVVPYGAPEHPHYRKFAFDVGEVSRR